VAPDDGISVASSEYDKAARRAVMPLMMKETITDGPEYLEAACPLSTNIPIPEKKRIIVCVFVMITLMKLTNSAPNADCK
jgi:hypothetical protein